MRHVLSFCWTGSSVLTRLIVDPTASSTFKTVAQGGFRVEYLSQLKGSGDFISDNFEIGGFSVKALQMGLALHSTVGSGIMGIGYQAGESVSTENRYPNLIDQLVSQNLINLRAYSLYLDDMETSTGLILFGGIDTEKFIGTLKVLPIQKDPQTQTFATFYVLMTSLSMTDQAGKTAVFTNADFPLSVILDSGTSLTFLPSYLVDAIISELGAVDDSYNSGLIFVDCDWRTTRSNEFLTFGFGGSGGPLIHVTLSEVIRSLRNKYPGSPFNNTCDLGIRATDTVYLLGDTFLRSAYVVYDIDHNQIALAQANFEATGSNIQEIPSTATGIPLLSGKATGVTQVPQSQFGTSTGSSSTGTPTSLNTVSSITAKSVTHSTVSGSGSGSTSTPMSGSTSGSISASTSMSASSTGGGTTTTPSSTGSSTSSSKSSAVRKVPKLRIGDLAVVFIPILIGLVGGSGFLVL